jgi:hypothetical protein
MLRAHATSSILDSVPRNARSRVPFRQPQPSEPAALALLPAAREPRLVVRSAGGCELRPLSRRCRVLLIVRSPRNWANAALDTAMCPTTGHVGSRPHLVRKSSTDEMRVCRGQSADALRQLESHTVQAIPSSHPSFGCRLSPPKNWE